MVILSNCLLNIYFHSHRFVLFLTLVEKLLIAEDSDEYRGRFLFKVLRRVTDFFICINLSPKGQGTWKRRSRKNMRAGGWVRCCDMLSYGCVMAVVLIAATVVCTRLGQGQAYQKIQYGMGERL